MPESGATGFQDGEQRGRSGRTRGIGAQRGQGFVPCGEQHGEVLSPLVVAGKAHGPGQGLPVARGEGGKPREHRVQSQAGMRQGEGQQAKRGAGRSATFQVVEQRGPRRGNALFRRLVAGVPVRGGDGVYARVKECGRVAGALGESVEPVQDDVVRGAPEGLAGVELRQEAVLVGVLTR